MIKPDPTTTINKPKLEVFRSDPRATIPSHANPGAIGYDISAFLLTERGQPSKKLCPPKSTTAIPTGLILSPPPNFYLQVMSRSGLAKNLSLFVANSPGIIDPDYIGELFILLFNGGYETQYILHEWRIAQIVLAPIVLSEIVEITTPPTSLGRGAAGFGSTGM